MTPTRSLWIIDPSTHTAEDQGVEQVLSGWTGTHRVFRPALRPGDGPGTGDGHDVDGVVLLGSAASVHDDLPWIRELSTWLAPCLDGGADVPVLGICFGHQLVAHLAGGRVRHLRPDRSKRLGYEHTRLDGGRLVPGRQDLRVVVSHCEHVEAPPEGYRVVATRPGVPVDGLEHETRPVFSFQFHPEARDEFAERGGLDPAGVDARLTRDSNRILEAFRGLVVARHRT